MNRRAFLAGAAGAAVASPHIARAATFAARQYHSQPETSHLHIYLSRIWGAVREETGGRLDVTVHARNNNSPVGDPGLLEMLQAGDLEFFVLNGNLLSAAHPVTDIQGIPFAFATPDAATRLWDGELGAYMGEELAAHGVRMIPYGAMENGIKQIISVDTPVRAAADLEGFRMRVPGGALFVDFYESLGAVPLVINFNRLQQALAAGEFDGLENPLVVVEENRLYETCKYISLTNHQWAGFNMLASEQFWRRLPSDVQDAVIRNARRFVPEQRAFVRAANARYRQSLENRGMTFVTPDAVGFRERLADAGFYARWRESVGARAWMLMENEVGPV